ncbi:hypothetical protein PI126_g10025 [Phytophthora idaei]|nr:hypothetical protein PI126_g10025 [Phytophthora idaei]
MVVGATWVTFLALRDSSNNLTSLVGMAGALVFQNLFAGMEVEWGNRGNVGGGGGADMRMALTRQCSHIA